MSGMWDVIIDIADAVRRLERASAAMSDASDLFQAIAQDMESITQANFEAQGRPEWAALEKSTIRARLKRNKGSSALMILQDSGLLAGSIASEYGSDYSVIGTNVPYARIHQYGGEIQRDGGEIDIRLRTDRRGNLLRQAGYPHLAVFAKKSHKQVRESTHQFGPYTITIPARPYLPFRGPPGQEILQPEARTTILQTVEDFISGAFK